MQEKQYTFDVAFPAAASNGDVYVNTIAPLIKHALHGINATVFAYGATGSGKTYTMVGVAADPGLMVRSMEELFLESEKFQAEEEVTVSASYLEVYNEVRVLGGAVADGNEVTVYILLHHETVQAVVCALGVGGKHISARGHVIEWEVGIAAPRFNRSLADWLRTTCR